MTGVGCNLRRAIEQYGTERGRGGGGHGRAREAVSLQEEPCKKTRRRSTDTWDDEGGVAVLPDDVVANILSFLPLRIHIAVCASSRTYADTWRWNRDLDFGGNSSPRDRRGAVVDARIIDRVLAMHRAPSLRKFRLAFCGDSGKLCAWLSFAFAKGVEELDVGFNRHGIFPVRLLAGIWTLRVLKLSSCQLVPCSASLPGLRVLALDRVYLHQPGWVAKAFDLSFPCVEVVDVRRCSAYCGLKVSSPRGRLRRLSLTCGNLQRVDVAADPRLSSLSYRGRFRALTISGDGEMGTLDDVSLFFTDDVAWARERVKGSLHRLVPNARVFSTNSRILEVQTLRSFHFF